jgi:hypothetical protein
MLLVAGAALALLWLGRGFFTRIRELFPAGAGEALQKQIKELIGVTPSDTALALLADIAVWAALMLVAALLWRLWLHWRAWSRAEPRGFRPS